MYLDREKWFKEQKDSLWSKLDYPNLPFIRYGDLYMSEHLACMRFIGKKYGLFPDNDEEQVVSDQTESFCFDIRSKFYTHTYSPDYDEKSRNEYIKYAREKLPYLDKFFSKRKEFVLGSKFSYVDVVVYNLIVLLNVFEKSLVDENPNLLKFVDRIDKLPNMIKYKSSKRWKKRYFCNPICKWRGMM